jgi:GNAT superfamily N-acetyltransferase
MDPLRLRPYRREDRAACQQLFEGNIPGSFFPHEIPLFMEFLDWFNGPYLVVEETGGAIVACGGLAEHAGFVTLCWGMVARTSQRLGIGRVLLQARLALVLDKPWVRHVSINTTNKIAPFFEKEGFTTRLVTPSFYAPGIDRHDMELRLGPEVRQRIGASFEALKAAGHQFRFSHTDC